MTLKEGKIYCIENFDYSADRYNNKCHFIKGNVYDMKEEKTEYFTLCITDNNNNKISFHSESPLAKIHIPKYFITEQEYRRKKLKKLQDESRR